MWRVREIADGFQTDHGRDPIAAVFAAARIDEASHLVTEKIGRLFVHKRDEAQFVLCSFSSKTPRQREKRSDPAAVIVSARRAEDRIVMCADENDIGPSAGNFRLDIVVSLPTQLITISSQM